MKKRTIILRTVDCKDTENWIHRSSWFSDMPENTSPEQIVLRSIFAAVPKGKRLEKIVFERIPFNDPLFQPCVLVGAHAELEDDKGWEH